MRVARLASLVYWENDDAEKSKWAKVTNLEIPLDLGYEDAMIMISNLSEQGTQEID